MYTGNMAGKSRSASGEGTSLRKTANKKSNGVQNKEHRRRRLCELCGEPYVPADEEEETLGLCPACRREAVRICPYCERPYRTDKWPHDLCPECYEEQEWQSGCGGEEEEDRFDCLEDY